MITQENTDVFTHVRGVKLSIQFADHTAIPSDREATAVLDTELTRNVEKKTGRFDAIPLARVWVHPRHSSLPSPLRPPPHSICPPPPPTCHSSACHRVYRREIDRLLSGRVGESRQQLLYSDPAAVLDALFESTRRAVDE